MLRIGIVRSLIPCLIRAPNLLPAGYGYDAYDSYRPAHSDRSLRVESRPEFPTPNPLPSFALSGQEQELVSPSASHPCPRISRISSSSYNSHAYNSASPRIASTSAHYQSVPEGYPSPVPSLTYDAYSSSSPQPPSSINTTPQSSYSELSDERPRQRRRVMHVESTPAEPCFEVNTFEVTNGSSKKGRKSRKREVHIRYA